MPEVQYERLKEVCTQCGKSYPEGTRFCPLDGMELMSTMTDPLIGTVLPRRHRILSLLGRGSMSVVYAGSYEPLDQPVAIKMLKMHLVSDPHQAKRFQQEIRTAGALSHPNIVGILDFGVTDQCVPYLVMEHLHGSSLSELLEKENRLSVNRAVRLFAQAADALAYAHTEGVVHRDIKPSNLIVVPSEGDTEEQIKVVDFGIAKIINAGQGSGQHRFQQAQELTTAGEVLGTPLYMSPEQASGSELDGRSDVYSLGCVLYHAITGQPPFVGETALDTIRLQISATAATIETVRPDLYIPERLQSIINKALQKDPRNRYQRMELMRLDLENCLWKETITPSVVISRADEQPVLVEPRREWKMPRIQLTLPVICGALAVVSLVSVISWGLLTDVGKKSPSISLGVANELEWHQQAADAQRHFSQGEYGTAIDTYKTAVAESRKFPQPDSRLASTLTGLAEVLLAEDRITDAERAANEALKVQNQISTTDPAIANIYLILSQIYRESGNLSQAKSLAQRALSIKQEALGPTHHDIAVVLENLAKIEFRHGQYKNAEELATKALKIARSSVGEEHAETASIMNTLGSINEHQQKYKAAEDYYTNALGTRQKVLGIEHPSVADTLCDLGALNYKTRRDASAEAMFNNALGIRTRVYGAESLKVAQVYQCLATLYDKQHNFPKAEDSYRKAVQVGEAVLGPNNPRLLPSLRALATFLRTHNQSNGAEVYQIQIARIEARE